LIKREALNLSENNGERLLEILSYLKKKGCPEAAFKLYIFG
jgi:hypothetical protein